MLMASMGAQFTCPVSTFFHVETFFNPITKIDIKSVIKITHQIAKVRKQTCG